MEDEHRPVDYDELIEFVVDTAVNVNNFDLADNDVEEIKSVLRDLIPLRLNPQQSWAMSVGLKALVEVINRGDLPGQKARIDLRDLELTIRKHSTEDISIRVLKGAISKALHDMGYTEFDIDILKVGSEDDEGGLEGFIQQPDDDGISWN